MKIKNPLKWYLYFWIGVSIFTIFRYMFSTPENFPTYTSMPDWAKTVLIFVRLGELAGALLLLKWNKLGFYCFLVSSLVGSYISIGIGGSSLEVLFWNVGGLVVLYYVMRPHWNKFSFKL